MKHFTGLMAAPFTPMKEDGNINYGLVEKYASFLIRNNVKGAFIGGCTGEGVSLTFEEKKKLFQEWGKYSDSSFTTIAMVGGNSIPESRELAQYAADSNITGIALLPPFFYKPVDAEHLAEICCDVLSVVPSLPAYYYHIPPLTGVKLSMLEFIKFMDESNNSFCGIKYSYDDLDDTINCSKFKNGKYNILWGRDETLIKGLEHGISGAVGSTYNYFAPLYTQIIENFNQGDLKTAKMLQKKSVEFCDFLGKYGGIGTGKAYMKLIGFDCGEFRQPVKNLNISQINELKSDLEQSGFYNFASIC